MAPQSSQPRHFVSCRRIAAIPHRDVYISRNTGFLRALGFECNALVSRYSSMRENRVGALGRSHTNEEKQ